MIATASVGPLDLNCLKQNTTYDAEEIIELLRIKSDDQFPVRYPKDNEIQRYLAFLSQVVASQGQIALRHSTRGR